MMLTTKDNILAIRRFVLQKWQRLNFTQFDKKTCSNWEIIMVIFLAHSKKIVVCFAWGFFHRKLLPLQRVFC